MLINEKLAAVIEKYRSHPEFLGIDVVDPNQPGAVDDTLLHIAARTGAVEDIEVLVASGASVNCSGDLGNTPLHQAAMRGEVASVKSLLQLGANASLRNEFNQTALEVAELGGHAEIVRILKTHIAR
jgi:ankyrin repeat protein